MRTAYYVASTHWDREWHDPFQRFRHRLVALLDEVFDLLESDPAYASFEMDGQVVPVLDYLEVRPHAAERVKRLSSAEKFRIGPWFVLPDEWLVSAESIVRNLEMGLEVADAYGAPRPLTAPLIDEFGHVSQMPQILCQLGFKGTSLHRGINFTDCGANFRWGSPDGSSLPCHKFGKNGYGTFQIAYRRVLEPDAPFDFEDSVKRLVEWTLLEGERTPGQPIFLLDSCDHIESEQNTSRMLAAANEKLNEHGILIEHSNSDRYIEALSASAATAESKLIEGELRETGKDDPEIDATCLIPGVLSSRVRLKQANACCEDELCQWAEPFSAFAAHLSGGKDPSDFLRVSWRYLLENQAHDSIGGCSVDQVHKDMEFRFDQSLQISRKLTEQALLSIARRCAPADLHEDALFLLVFNPGAEEISRPVDLQVRLPTTWKTKYQEFFGYEELFTFRILDAEGSEVPWQRNGQSRDRKGVRRLMRKIPAEDIRHVIDVTATLQIPAYGYTALLVEPAARPARYPGTQRIGERAMENEFLRVEVEADGAVSLLAKETGATYRGLFSFEDRADVGDGWYWYAPANDVAVGSGGSTWKLSVIADGPEKTTLQIETRLNVPESFDFKDMKRSSRQTELIIRNNLTLRRGARVLESAMEVDNNVQDHRLRVLFPTDLEAGSYCADTAFDAVERPVALVPDNGSRRELDVDGRPQQTWTAFGDGERGLAVVSRGLYESGVVDRPGKPLFLTLLRGFRRAIFSNDNPGGQSLGHHSFRLDLIPFAGAIPKVDLFQRGQQIAASARGLDVLARDLPAFDGARLPRSLGMFKLDGKVVITSIRLSAQGEWKVRLFNPEAGPAKFSIGLPNQIASASAETLSGARDESTEVTINNGVAVGMLAAKRIVTVRLNLAAQEAETFA